MKEEQIEYNIYKLNNKEEVPYNLLLLADPSKKAIEDYLSRGMIYVCKTNEIIGVYILISTRPNTMELVNIAVKENMQGKGIGKKLVLHAIEIAKKEGIRILEVGTGNSSLGQLGLYQKCGFRIIGIDKDYFINNYDEEIIENSIRCMDMIRLRINL